MYNAEDILKEKSREMICVSPEVTLAEALAVMLENKIGAILVKENEDIVGIWTERDLMKNVTEDGFHTKTSQIKNFMTKTLFSAPHDVSLFSLLDMFLGKRLRHLLIKKENKYIGLISTGDVIKTSLNEKSRELDELNEKYNWDYYENWKFQKK
ncbi:MAG: CBS domain-containing protein [Bacteroidetes bacterium]|nr:CBS domain-containing protein [Bacteroidota bacterium]MBU1677458.1 CBS domain-containing protein [Bacteroidota bacterium]MBU2505276.1 CBS domain-containing protein [Bacteroidota bacterium]